STKRHADYLDFGIKYRFPAFSGSGFLSKWSSYVGVGGGIASVKTKSTFSVNGVDVTGQLLDVYGVELGNDLTDRVTKGLFMFTLGAQRALSSRYFVDASYRYGHIFSSGNIVDDTGTNTNRLQGG